MSRTFREGNAKDGKLPENLRPTHNPVRLIPRKFEVVRHGELLGHNYHDMHTDKRENNRERRAADREALKNELKDFLYEN